METMALGFFALTTLIISICCLYSKKPMFGLVGTVVSAALTFLTGYYWKEMLIDSGKDTALLGFNSYPAAPIILAVLLLTAFVVMIVSIVWLVRHSKSRT